MYAAYNSTLKKTALFLTLARAAAPFAAQAQTAFVFPNGATATLNGTTAGCVQVNADSGTIKYNAFQQAPPAGTVDPRLTFTGGNQGSVTGATTGFQLCFQDLDSSANITPGVHTI